MAAIIIHKRFPITNANRTLKCHRSNLRSDTRHALTIGRAPIVSAIRVAVAGLHVAALYRVYCDVSVALCRKIKS